MRDNASRSSVDRITSAFLQHVGPFAESCNATVILLCMNAFSRTPSFLAEKFSQRICYVTQSSQESTRLIKEERQVIQIPNVPLTRIGRVKIAVFLGVSSGLLKREDIVVSLSGPSEGTALDTITAIDVGREFEMFLAPYDGEELAPKIMPEVLERVIDIAAELGSEGREGKPVGAFFVIGDVDRVLPLSRQIILNPFQGYPEQDRNLLDPGLEETVKELSTIDGAFIIRGDGIIEAAGAYLKTTGQDAFKLPRGLGSRHHTAAAITSDSDSVAVTVSESTGTVTVFRNGRIITEIEKPRTVGLRPFTPYHRKPGV